MVQIYDNYNIALKEIFIYDPGFLSINFFLIEYILVVFSNKISEYAFEE